jgi:hypothetical protein
MSSGTYLTIALLLLFWGAFGLMQPRMMFFARPEWQTRYNAFYFPVTCAVFFVFCFLSASGAGISWIITILIAIFPIFYFLVLCGVGIRKNVLKPDTKIRSENESPLPSRTHDKDK